MWLSTNLFYNVPHIVYMDAEGRLRPGPLPTLQKSPAKAKNAGAITKRRDARRYLSGERVVGVEHHKRTAA
jgi:hypothetical protein